MNKIILPDEVQKEVDKEGSNVVPFDQPRPAVGGGPPPANCWLRKLGEGAIFFAQPAGKQPLIYTEYHVIAHHDRTTILFVRDPSGQNEVYLPFNPVVFSIQFELVEVVKNGEPIE